ncbi:MAG: ATP-binding protein [Chloroflexota bacterium]|nr:ATP-binding protein [Chloroflexota bacterium]
MMTESVLVAWSGGKDSAMALYRVQRDPRFQVLGLLTTVTADYDRVTMHGVRRTLLEQQARHLRLPLHQVTISRDASNDEYEAAMEAAMARFHKRGVTSVVFGDIHLEDVRRYREENLARAGMKAVFPIWGEETQALVRSFIELGFRAIVTCVDSKVLDGAFCGRVIDDRFLSELPTGIDPCGENGEYHSFVFDGPVLDSPVPYTRGETVIRDALVFLDLLTGEAGP